MTAPTILTESLGGSPLAIAALNGGMPHGWYRPPPASTIEWRVYADDLREAFSTGDWLGALAPAFAASGAAAERLATVAAGQGVVITTGQQPGLFGGPLYTWYKALTALAFADVLQDVTGTPVAPVFWAATDDSDFAEGASTWIAAPGGAERLVIPPLAKQGMSLAEIPLPDVSAQLRELRAAARSAAYNEPLRAVEHAYGENATLGDAYVALLRALLEPLGIAVLDAAHAATRMAADPLLRAALRAAPGIERAVSRRTADIEASGWTPQVPMIPGLSLVFATGSDGTRARVPVASAAAAAHRESPGSLGANVLLRPVVERTLLPTMAYVAGAGEIAYFAQVSAVASELSVPVPLALPRWSGTIVELHIAELLGQLGLEPADLHDKHAAERGAAEAAVSADVRSALARLREAVDEAARTLAASSAGVPESVAKGGAGQLHHRIDRLSRRYRAAARHTVEGKLRDIGTARGSLYPGGARQERALNFLPLLARHGVPLLDQLRAAASRHAAEYVGAGARADTPATIQASAPVIIPI